jgi:hypothetical protein
MKTYTDENDLARLQSLITGYTGACSNETSRSNNVFGEMLSGFLAKRAIWAESQRALADDFNLFEVMDVDGDERRHSKILAWLLDHRIEHGTHAQGNLGFRLFLEELGSEIIRERDVPRMAYADIPNYWVHLEISGDESRIDIEIAARAKFLIHIEVKIHSMEGDHQTDRECRDLRSRGIELDVPELARHGIFLTLDGRKARNEHFVPVRWSRIAKVLEMFALEAKPADVKLFARHYAKAVKKLSRVDHEEIEAEDAKV